MLSFLVFAGCVVVLVAIAMLTGAFDLGPKPPRPRAIAFHQLRENEWELELADGTRYRTEHGYVWHHFPSGVRVGLDLEEYLQEQLDRLKLVDKWTE